MAIISIHPERSFWGIPIMDVLERAGYMQKNTVDRGW
jgi:hypothetical protein